ncbi:hypothetical protein EG68_07762 [Paragonimus skrjabini miyazakii]|uniref:Uncharacterized protein n=1 Tax=Paragonimus skrjabini miyazakii TaxID=59628 RepID=A0A8S9YRY0_9TREM|nr:hypothetical protein EG68_07762 [Paragonimus skrjabini miyazakii]
MQYLGHENIGTSLLREIHGTNLAVSIVLNQLSSNRFLNAGRLFCSSQKQQLKRHQISKSAGAATRNPHDQNLRYQDAIQDLDLNQTVCRNTIHTGDRRYNEQCGAMN